MLKVTATIGTENAFSADDDAPAAADQILTMFTNWVNKVNITPTGSSSGDSVTQTKLDTLLTRLEQLAMALEDVKTAVGKLSTDLDAFITAGQASAADLQAKLAEATAKALELAANDAADAAQIADLKAQLDAVKTASDEVIAALNAADVKVTTSASGVGVTLPPAVPPVN